MVLLAVGVLTAAAVGCGGPPESASATDRTKLLPVAAYRATACSEFSHPLRFYGRVRAVRRASLAFELTGQIAELLIDEGESIERGQPMARLNTSLLTAEKERLLLSRKLEETLLRRLLAGERDEVIESARAAVARMEAETERAVLRRDRLETLRVRNAASASEYEEALYQSRSLEASLREAVARLTELESGAREEDVEAQQSRLAEVDAQIAVLDVRMEKTTLLAPFPAHVVQRFADEGAVVRAGDPIFTIVEKGRHEAVFSLPINQLEPSRKVTSILVDGAEVPVENARVVSSVSPETRTANVVFELPAERPFLDGQSCTLSLRETVRAECARIPVSALLPSIRGLWSCYRLEREDGGEAYRVVREEVTINYTDGDWAFVEPSLATGSLVVKAGVHKLVPGMRVRLGTRE